MVVEPMARVPPALANGFRSAARSAFSAQSAPSRARTQQWESWTHDGALTPSWAATSGTYTPRFTVKRP
jgi:hypothetical protein